MENNTIQIFEKISTRIPYSENGLAIGMNMIFLLLLILVLGFILLDIFSKYNKISIVSNKRILSETIIVITILILANITLIINIFKPTLLDKVFNTQTGYNSVEVTDKNKYDLIVTSNKEYLMLDKKNNDLILKYRNNNKSWYTDQTTFKILGETNNAYLIEANMTNYDYLDSETMTKQLLLPKK